MPFPSTIDAHLAGTVTDAVILLAFRGLVSTLTADARSVQVVDCFVNSQRVGAVFDLAIAVNRLASGRVASARVIDGGPLSAFFPQAASWSFPQISVMPHDSGRRPHASGWRWVDGGDGIEEADRCTR